MEKIPKQTILVIGLCAALIVAFLGLAVYPKQRSISGLNSQIRKIENRIKEQATLLPLYENLSEIARFEKPEALPFPMQGRLSLHDTERLSSLFDAMARRNRLTLVDAIPDIQSLEQGNQSLAVNILLRGDFSDLRHFLLALGGMPALRRVEEIRIKSADRTQDMIVRVSMAMKKS
jgi:hypothetical protein